MLRIIFYRKTQVQMCSTSVIYQNPLEKFCGRARQCFDSIFHIDINGVMVVGKVERLHQLVKPDVS